MFIKYQSLSHFLKLISVSLLAGILSGLAASLFLHSLKFVTTFREAHEWIIWFLPLGGLAIGLLYHHYGKDLAAGNNLIFDEIHDPKKKVPIIMAPFIYLGTVVTHLFGGSAGREGTAVQMAASLSDQLTSFFELSVIERRALLVLGAGAGFGAAIGAPLAGIVFGMEVIHVGKLKPFALLECLIASFSGYFITVLLQTPHTHYPQMPDTTFSFTALGYALIAGIVFGVTSRIFSKSTHVLEHSFSFIKYPPLKPFVGGCILVMLFKMEGSYIYDGLGLDIVIRAFSMPESFLVPLKKLGFTALTLASGFKGGEFVPLVYMGSTLGSAFGTFLPSETRFFTSLGFASVFAGASNTPLACSIMACELFGWELAPYVLVSCYMSYYFSGHRGIYKSQRVLRHKHHLVRDYFLRG